MGGQLLLGENRKFMQTCLLNQNYFIHLSVDGTFCSLCTTTIRILLTRLYLLGRIQAVCRPHLHQHCPSHHHTLFPILHCSIFQLVPQSRLIHQQASGHHHYSLRAMQKIDHKIIAKYNQVSDCVLHWKKKTTVITI